jgi:cytochrome b6-f complex iron-sulfur subunit
LNSSLFEFGEFMKRRDFLTWVGVGTLATSLPIALAACNSDSPTTESDQSPGTDSNAATDSPPEVDSTPRDDGFAAVGTVATLDEKGFISDKAFFAGSVMVIRNPDDPAALIAVNSMCPHQGCGVEWKSADNQFQCPCHGSAFGSDGSLISGPATKALGNFDVKVEDNLVLIKTT